MMSEHDKALLDSYSTISDLQWWMVDENQADSPEGRKAIESFSNYLYHLEEGNDI